jgi:hypothetical protein
LLHLAVLAIEVGGGYTQPLPLRESVDGMPTSEEGYYGHAGFHLALYFGHFPIR